MSLLGPHAQTHTFSVLGGIENWSPNIAAPTQFC